MSDYDTPLSLTLRALVAPQPLLLAGLTVAAALLIAPWLAIPGILAWGWSVNRHGPARYHRNRRRLELGLDLKDAPAGLKRWNTLLHQSLAQVDQALAHTAPRNASLLRPVKSEVEALGTDIRNLIRNAYAIHRYLAATSPVLIKSRIEHLENQVTQTTDAFARQQLVEAITALRRQVDNYEQLRGLLGRTEAILENMQASLDAIVSSVIRLNSGDLGQAQITRDESLDKLTAARSTVASLEEVYRSMEVN